MWCSIGLYNEKYHHYAVAWDFLLLTPFFLADTKDRYHTISLKTRINLIFIFIILTLFYRYNIIHSFQVRAGFSVFQIKQALTG